MVAEASLSNTPSCWAAGLFPKRGYCDSAAYNSFYCILTYIP
jgi:hypothetical protein